MARELTKRHEELWRGNLGAAADEFAGEGRARGEVTLLIEGSRGGTAAHLATAAEESHGTGSVGEGDCSGVSAEAIRLRLRALMDAGESPSHARPRLRRPAQFSAPCPLRASPSVSIPCQSALGGLPPTGNAADSD